jgi:hypothetical protein
MRDEGEHPVKKETLPFDRYDEVHESFSHFLDWG